MFGEKRDRQASSTNAKCDKVNIKLDSPQSESDRGESQLNVGRAACWLHFFLPSHWIDEKRELCILYISPGALSHSILSIYFLSVCRTLFNSSSLYLSSMVLLCRDVCLSVSLFLLSFMHLYYQYVWFLKMVGGVWERYRGGFLGGCQGVSGWVSKGFPGVSRGFLYNLTHCFSKIEGVSAGPAKP